MRKYHQFPYIVGVDIFVLDYVPRDAEKEEYRNKAARYAIEVADEICTKELSEEETEQYLSIVEKICSIKIPRELISRKHDLRVYLYDIAERLFDAFDEEESDKLTRMMPEGLYNKRMRLKKEYYDDIIRLPFENTTIPVPMAYDEMLRERYGDYMKMVKNAGGHDYPFFETQQKQLDEVMAKEGIVFPKFTFSKESLVRPENDKSNSCKVLAIDLKNQLEEQYMQLQDAFDMSDYDKASEILVNSQQSAIDLGTIIENCKGEGGKTVALLQDYCEYIFKIYESVSQVKKDIEPDMKVLYEILQQIKESVKKEVVARREVVFITYKAVQWERIKDVYEAAAADDNCDVYVIAVPYYYKDFDGTMHDMQYEAGKYPADIKITAYDEFDFGLHCPDIIFTQNAYDNENPVVSIHTFFYSDNLRKYTDKLVYIPPFEVEEFTKENYREYLNMKHYCTVPGVINADKTFVQSQNMRHLYIEKLTEFAGEDTRKVWEDKIVCVEAKKAATCSLDEDKQKIILYYTGLSGFASYEEKMVEKIECVLKVFYENKNDVTLIWKPNPLTESALMDKKPQLYHMFKRVKDNYCAENWGLQGDSYEDKELVRMCDAYYGDASPVAQMFRNAGKPVMLQDVQITY